MKYRRTIFKALSLTIALSASWSAWAVGLQARINSPQVSEGDSFQLTLTAEGKGLTTPDLSPLSRDFVIRGTSSSSRTSIINGNRQDTTSWVVALSPKKKGQLTIPSLQAGSLSSEELQIKVTDVSQSPKAVGATGVSVSVELEKGPLYLFQEVPLKVRIETIQTLQQAGLIAPQGDAFNLRQVGEDQVSQITRSGRVLTVIERSYMLQIEKSGSMTLPPFVLEGTIADSSRRSRDPFFSGFGFNDSFFDDLAIDPFMSRGKPFRVRSDAIELDVQGKTASTGNSGDWFLPAKKVELTSEWIDNYQTFKKEKAVVRRIRVQALGARPEQIPTLDLGSNADVKIYLDDSSSALMETTQGTVAQKTIELSVVPMKAGDIIVPEIRLEWFNTTTGKPETAVLAAETINVSENNISEPLLQNNQAVQPKQQSASMPDKRGSNEDRYSTTNEEQNSYWKYLLFLFLMLIAGGWFWWYRGLEYQNHQSNNHSSSQKFEKSTEKTLGSGIQETELQELQSLIKVVKTSDVQATYKALSRWLRVRNPNSYQIALEEQLRALESILFASKKDKAVWDKTVLVKVLELLAVDMQCSAKKAVLPPLYPTTN